MAQIGVEARQRECLNLSRIDRARILKPTDLKANLADRIGPARLLPWKHDVLRY
jgi:hypothetical protein